MCGSREGSIPQLPENLVLEQVVSFKAFEKGFLCSPNRTPGSVARGGTMRVSQEIPAAIGYQAPVPWVAEYEP